MSDGKPAIFLDRDGTLIVETRYLHEPDKVELIPGAGEAVQQLAEKGFELFIVTNQAGIGRGYYAEEQMHAVNERVAVEFAKFGVAFRKIYFAPEAPISPAAIGSLHRKCCSTPMTSSASTSKPATWSATRFRISNAVGTPA